MFPSSLSFFFALYCRCAGYRGCRSTGILYLHETASRQLRIRHQAANSTLNTCAQTIGGCSSLVTCGLPVSLQSVPLANQVFDFCFISARSHAAFTMASHLAYVIEPFIAKPGKKRGQTDCIPLSTGHSLTTGYMFTSAAP